jgi:hypothetical protein
VTARARKPAPPEPAVIRDVALLEDVTEGCVRALLAALAVRWPDVRVTETLRTEDRQRWLHALGRTTVAKDGRGKRGTVTGAATAATTWHAYGLAADLFSPTAGWDVSSPFWTELLARCAEFDLRSGADWNANGLTRDERFVDWPHVQLRRGPTGIEVPRSPTAVDQADYRAGHLAAVWARYGLRGDTGAVPARAAA